MADAPLIDTKRALRREIRARVAALDARARADQAAAAAAHLRALAARASCVAVYVALPDEIELGPWLRELAADGRLALPRVTPHGLRFHAASPDALVLARGLHEPPAEAPERTPDLVVVPGRAFDARGARLGRGGGYYDRYLAAHPGARAVGVGFDVQRVDAVPEDPWDVRLPVVVLGGDVLGSFGVT